MMLFASNNVSFQTEGITSLKIIGYKFFQYFEKLLLIEKVPQIVPVQGCLGNQKFEMSIQKFNNRQMTKLSE